MATIGNYKDQYIIFDSSVESAPEVMPVTGGPIPFGQFFYDIATGKVYAMKADGTLEEQ